MDSGFLLRQRIAKDKGELGKTIGYRVPVFSIFPAGGSILNDEPSRHLGVVGGDGLTM
jgi:hypothetical protein